MHIRDLSSTRMLISAPAKVNLYLELLGKRSDGFHEIETIMSTVSLFDQLDFTSNNSGELKLRVQLNDRQSDPVPTGPENLIIKALQCLRDSQDSNVHDAHSDLGMNIDLLKRIPSAAGLGGASSDAAAAILAGNALWDLGLSLKQLEIVAAKIGSDVPFFLSGGIAMCRGRGEIIEPIDGPSGLVFVIAKPPASISTPRVYGCCKPAVQPRSSDRVISAMTSGNPHLIAGGLFNRLQAFAGELTDEILHLENAFDDLPCLGHQMSGSGSSYFGLFGDLKTARSSAARLMSRWPALKIHCVTSLNRCHALTA